MGVVGSLSLNEINHIQNDCSISNIPNVTNNNHNQIFYPGISRERLYIKKYSCDSLRRRSLKHKLQYKKTYQSKRIFNSTHDNIREELKKQIHKLEFTQNNLLTYVEKLYLYKQKLEIICEQVSNTNHEFIQ